MELNEQTIGDLDLAALLDSEDRGALDDVCLYLNRRSRACYDLANAEADPAARQQHVLAAELLARGAELLEKLMIDAQARR